ncbi:fatty acyl-AMP ligase [Burkholderia pseudomallei]|uniref:fatty acyl-AMP ligase n=1 Tax=Burkholderia pseudomallei TaxID=28450 RepID=UPI003459EAAA
MTAIVPAAAAAATMVDIVRARADRQPDRPAYTYLPEQEGAPAELLDYASLVQRAHAIAAALDRRLAGAPDAPRMAMLLFAPGPDFLAAFWGCLSARVIAIPAQLPRPGRCAATLEAIVRNAGVRLVLASRPQADAIGRTLARSPALAGLDTLFVDDALADGAGRPAPARPAADDIAFLQYTSGSTSRPKGVVVRHRNLVANERMIAQAMSLDHASTSVVWMPHYHDMGLIGGMLQPLYSGAHCVAMAPTTFLKRPLRWLQAIAQWRAVSSGGPDFAYRLCVERIAPEQAAGLDLSSWRVAFNGAEPVRAATIAAFAERFGPAGFRAHASYPCYGMAEATLLAAGGRAGDGARVRRISAAALAAGRAEPPAPGDAGTAAVCCGAPPAGARLAVVDPATRQRLADGLVGELWIAGPHVADGYHRAPEASAAAFGAAIAGPEPDAGPWLRTGDLGFVLDGGVYVTGRLKEMMIVNGRNLYPHDVEDTLREGLAEIRDAAVFALIEPGGRERTVAILELAAAQRRLILQPDAHADAGLQAIAMDARALAARACELPLDHVRLSLPGAIVKTTSGKTRYGELRARMLALPESLRQAPVSIEAGRARREEA